MPADAKITDLRPRLIHLEPYEAEYTRVLSGPPETVSMRSGLVVLQPACAVGKHSTGTCEEVLIVLAGAGEMRFADGTTLELTPDHVAYCPPATEHDVVNTSSEPLRYLYVVARAQL